MPETLAPSYVVSKNEMHSLAPWAFLLRIDIDGTNGLFVCGHDATISYGGILYQPFPIGVEKITQDTEGNLPLLEVTLANIGREAAVLLEQDYIVDRPFARLLLVNTDNLSDPAVPWGDHTVQDARVTLEGVVLSMGPYNLFETQLPSRRQNRNRCDYLPEYGGLECQYSLALANLISVAQPLFDPTSCDGGLDTSNGCVAHGDNEVANGKPRKHPLRWGAHKGIPKGPARV